MEIVASAVVEGELFFYNNGLSYGWKGHLSYIKAMASDKVYYQLFFIQRR